MSQKFTPALCDRNGILLGLAADIQKTAGGDLSLVVKVTSCLCLVSRFWLADPYHDLCQSFQSCLKSIIWVQEDSGQKEIHMRCCPQADAFLRGVESGQAVLITGRSHSSSCNVEVIALDK